MKKITFLVAITLLFLSCNNKSNPDAVKPQASNITESVYASVKLTPKVSYYAQTLRPGIMDKIYVEEGDFVKEGQILFEIAATTSDKAQLIDAQLNFDEAQSNFNGQNNLLNNIELEIKSLKEQARLDSINFKRQERLWSQNIGKQLDYDQHKLKYNNSKNQLKILEQKFEQTKTSLQNNYKKAFNRIQSEKNQLEKFQVYSEINGTVYSINKEEGDFVSTQEKISEIGSHNNFKIEMDIDEVDITKIELNDSVLISLDAYPDDIYIGKVSKIYTKKDDATQTFKVESSFLKTPSKLYYGLSGEANIIVSKRENTLIIPSNYLLPNNKVLTSDGEKKVSIGMKNLEFTEILSGIDTTTVLINPNE